MTNKSEWRCRTRARVAVRRLTVTAATVAALASVAGTVSAAGPERTLAGISIFAPGSEVTRKFGNPSRILVGGLGASAVSSTSGASGGPGGMSGSPGGMGGSPGGYPGASGGSSANPGAGLLPGFGGVPTGSSISYPGMSGSESPGGSPGGYPGSSGGYPGSSGGLGGPGGVPVGPPPKQPVTLIYDRANGGSLEFTISPDKRVIQIRETGYNGAYGTARGIKLGTSYAQVVSHYGYPENTYIQGSIISTDYKDTLHCGFQFLNQKLVGIIVASPD